MSDAIPPGFTLFIYPFEHEIAPAGADNETDSSQRWSAIATMWEHQLTALSQCRESCDAGRDPLTCDIDDSYFMLPQVRELVFPEYARLEREFRSGTLGTTTQTSDLAWFSYLGNEIESRFKRLTHLDEVARLRESAGPHQEPASMLRLCLRAPFLEALQGHLPQSVGASLDKKGERCPSGLVLSRRVSDEESAGEFTAEDFFFAIRNVDAFLFPDGLGFLVFEVVLDSPTHHGVVRFLDAARHIWAPDQAFGSVKDQTTLQPSLTLDQSETRFSWLTMLQWLLTPFNSTQFDTPGTIPTAPWLLGADSLDFVYRPFAQVHGTAFKFINVEYSKHTGVDRLLSLSETIVGHLASETGWKLDNDKISELKEHNAFQHWDNWSALLWDGHAAVEMDQSLRFPAENWRGDYLSLFLLAGYQRLRLIALLEALDEASRLRGSTSQHVTDNRTEEARRLWDAVIWFRNRYWFPMVTDQLLGAPLYARMRSVMQLEVLMTSVDDEVQLLDAYFTRIASEVAAEDNAQLTGLLAALAIAAPWLTIVVGVATILSIAPIRPTELRSLIAFVSLFVLTVGPLLFFKPIVRHVAWLLKDVVKRD